MAYLTLDVHGISRRNENRMKIKERGRTMLEEGRFWMSEGRGRGKEGEEVKERSNTSEEVKREE